MDWLTKIQSNQTTKEKEQDDAYEFLYQRELDFSKRTVQIINHMNPLPKFVVVCGDLVNAYPTQQEGRVGQKRQVEDFKQIFNQINREIPLVCVCGNHDVGDRPNGTSIDLYTSRFGDDYFTFYVQNIKFMVLNTQLYKDGTQVPDQVDRQVRRNFFSLFWTILFSRFERPLTLISCFLISFTLR